jgi:hypothetical protein
VHTCGGGTFIGGEGHNLERRGTHIVEEALPIAWRLTPFVVAYFCAIEGSIVNEGT